MNAKNVAQYFITIISIGWFAVLFSKRKLFFDANVTYETDENGKKCLSELGKLVLIKILRVIEVKMSCN